MNKLQLQMGDGTTQEVSVHQLAVEGMKIAISENGKLALMKMAQNAVHAEARNDANNILWLTTFGPALCGVLAQHESALAIAAQKMQEVKDSGGENGPLN